MQNSFLILQILFLFFYVNYYYKISDMTVEEKCIQEKKIKGNLSPYICIMNSL